MKNVHHGLTIPRLVVLILLLIFLFRIFFYASDSGIIHSSFYKGPDPYVRLSDGREIRATPCAQEIGQGNTIEFTTLGLELSIGNRQISTSVVIHCHISGWVLDGPLP